MRLYLAGWQATSNEYESRLINDGVITDRCFSFANLARIPGLPYYRPNIIEGYKVAIDKKIGIMMDSGVFSFRWYKINNERKGKQAVVDALATPQQFLDRYVRWCKKYEHLWDFYVTCDFFAVSKDIVKAHAQLLKRGIRPVPVFHGDDTLDYLRAYIDMGHDYICVGSSKRLRTNRRQIRNYLDAMFNEAAKYKDIKFHGLAVTAPWAVIGYPWASVDSSSWSRAAGYGCILQFDPRTHRLSTLHISKRDSDKSVMEAAILGEVKEMVELKGYDWEELRSDHIMRHHWNAKQMQDMAKYASKVQRTKWNHFV